MGLLEEVGKVRYYHPLKPTLLAYKLLEEGGWDPYLEDMGTLWLLHWQIISNQSRGLVWFLIFTSYLESEFNKKRLFSFVSRQFDHLGVHTTPNTIEREIDCCLRTYVPARAIRGTISEDNLDCPLAELDLVRYFPDDGSYHFNIGPKISLPSALFGYALLNFLPRLTQTRRTVAIEECVYQPGSPGQAFKLDENSVVEHLDWLEKNTNEKLRIQETAGLRQIYISDELSENWDTYAIQLLENYYAQQ
jgi:hypothetical protein